MKRLGILSLLALSYTAGAQSGWPLWNHYQDYFIQKDGRVVDYERDNLTTSEGQGYAMFFALVANDRGGFDRIYRWTVNNLADGDLKVNLPAWSWGRKQDGTLGVKDSNSASDADLWIAYDLLQAAKLWNNPEYVSVANELLNQIATREVSNRYIFPILLPAHSGFEHEDSAVANTSYMPLFLLEAAAKAQPAGPWRRIANAVPILVAKSTINGFASDWFQINSSGMIAPASPLDSNTTQVVGSYDAIRVYLWTGLTPASVPGRNSLLKSLYGMASYMKLHPLPPEYATDGQPPTHGVGPISFSAALIPFLDAVQEPDAVTQQQQRLSSSFSVRSNLYGNPPRYYDQNLAMFAVGFTEHRYRILSNGDVGVSWRK